MNKVMPFVLLDFITIKPYLTIKNILLYIGVAVVMSVSSDNMGAAIGFLMIFGTLFSNYPFAVGEKSSIDVLYTTLSIKRNTVVLGRYLFALILDLFMGLSAYILSFVLLSAKQKSFDSRESLYTILIMLLLSSLIQAFQLPIYFKLGYTKARMLAYLPFLLLPLTVLSLNSLLKDVFSLEMVNNTVAWLSANLSAVALAGVLLWLMIMVLSYRLSLSFYGKRDF